MTNQISAQEFVQKWRRSEVKESASSQEHFIDVCRLIGHGTPIELDPKGDWFTFEAGAEKLGGKQGWADVWKKKCFAWEYKGKHKDLEGAYKQLLQYREALLNPPLLIVSDMDVIQISTNFTNTAKQVYVLELEDLLTKEGRDILYMAFNKPHELEVPITPDQVTEEAAGEFAKLADILRKWGEDPHTTAHFLIRLLFCLFAEDIGLLPRGLFTHLVEQAKGLTNEFTGPLRGLFATMASGGHFGADRIAHFDGSLFDDEVVLEVPSDGLDILRNVCGLDWSSIEPAILGTLFERSLDPSRRAELGAHYTSRDDIELVVEPVLMNPLREKWDRVKAQAPELSTRSATARGKPEDPGRELDDLLGSFMDEISSIRVLDPACGSGNFLYVALQKLLDLQKEVVSFSREFGLDISLPSVSPEQLFGIELNTYAYELAQTTVWIGYIQWMYENGFDLPGEPILKPLGNILNMDAVVSYSGDKPTEPNWPEADVIIGNPPYLGNKKMKAELGVKYVDDLRSVYKDRVPGESDLVCYWFEKSRSAIEASKASRAGLLATQAIRGGANQVVLQRIKESGDIFWAESDRKWVLDGATVHVSMVGFDDGSQGPKTLDGTRVDEIFPDLSSALDLTQTKRLRENRRLSFMGVTPSGPFDIPSSLAKKWLESTGNPNHRPNSDVIRRYFNAEDITEGSRDIWIVDFGVDMPLKEAAEYEAPFEYLKEHVKPFREESKVPEDDPWWLFTRPRPRMRKALQGLDRYIAIPMVSKHHLVTWLSIDILPANLIIVIAREDDYFFGIIHSRIHELWARRKGTQLRDAESGSRYTPTTVFQTYPFPWPPGEEPAHSSSIEAISEASRELVEKRTAWLEPQDLTEAQLKTRTLTNLYNENPTWLQHCHARLDEAVLDLYGWSHDFSDEDILKNLLELNRLRSGGG